MAYRGFDTDFSMSDTDDDDRADAAELWWLPVAGGVLAILYAFLMLSFSFDTVRGIAVFAGVGWVAVGLLELVTSMPLAQDRVLRFFGLLALIGGGVVALLWWGTTFVVLARLSGWVLLFTGVLSIIDAVNQRHRSSPGWWLPLALGVANLGVAVWAVRYSGRALTLLVLWVGFAILARGLSLILLGVTARSFQPVELRS